MKKHTKKREKREKKVRFLKFKLNRKEKEISHFTKKKRKKQTWRERYFEPSKPTGEAIQNTKIIQTEKFFPDLKRFDEISMKIGGN